MKVLVTGSLLLISGAAIAQTANYRLIQNGKEVGTMQGTDVYTAARHSDHVLVNISQGGQQLSMESEDVETAAGDWVSSTMKVHAATTNVTISASPTSSGAHVVIETGGEHEARDIPKISRMSTRDTSITWFRVRIPKVGETASYQHFDIQTLKWKETTLKYIGPKNVQSGGKTRHGFAVQKTEGGKTENAVLDQANQPITYTAGEVTLERIYK